MGAQKEGCRVRSILARGCGTGCCSFLQAGWISCHAPRLNVCCLFRALGSDWELLAQKSGSDFRPLWRGPACCRARCGTGGGGCYGAGERARKWAHTAQRCSWAWLYLMFRQHFWCFKDIQHFERLLNADLCQVPNNLFTCGPCPWHWAGHPPMIQPNPTMSHYYVDPG